MIFAGKDTTFINELKVNKIKEIKSLNLNENNEDEKLKKKLNVKNVIFILINFQKRIQKT